MFVSLSRRCSAPALVMWLFSEITGGEGTEVEGLEAGEEGGDCGGARIADFVVAYRVKYMGYLGRVR